MRDAPDARPLARPVFRQRLAQLAVLACERPGPAWPQASAQPPARQERAGLGPQASAQLPTRQERAGLGPGALVQALPVVAAELVRAPVRVRARARAG